MENRIEDLRAVEKSIWRYLDKYMLGGGCGFKGWDWPTLRMLFPRIAVVLAECKATEEEG